jgi:hypothetical protein
MLVNCIATPRSHARPTVSASWRLEQGIEHPPRDGIVRHHRTESAIDVVRGRECSVDAVEAAVQILEARVVGRGAEVDRVIGDAAERIDRGCGIANLPG